MNIKALFTIICLSLVPAAGMSQTNNLHIDGTISPDMILTGETIYLFTLSGNEYTLMDSCRIEESGRSFSLKGRIPHSDMIAYLVLPPRSYTLRLSPGEHIFIDIDPDTRDYPTVEGSPLTNEEGENSIRMQKLRERLVELQARQQESALDPEQRSIIAAELENVRYDLNTGNYLHYISITKSPSTYRSLLRILSGKVDGRKRVADEDIDSLVSVMKANFPDDPVTRSYPVIPSSPPPSDRSNETYKLMKSLTSSPAPTEPYRPGDRVKGEGIMSCIKDIRSDYILIDFWAAWCAPCMKEMPNLKNVADKYKGRLTVVAVSLDNSIGTRDRTIEKEQLKTFTHVYIGNNNPESSLLLNQFGVKAIPANFLLDKNRRIIAVNLRGEALERKMKELSQ